MVGAAAVFRNNVVNGEVAEQVAHGRLQVHIDQFNGLERDVDSDPAPAQVVGRDAECLVSSKNRKSGTLPTCSVIQRGL